MENEGKERSGGGGGRQSEMGRRIDGGGGVLRDTPAGIEFFCSAVDAADCGI